MPIYEYQCNVCSNVDEHFMRMSDPDPKSCSKCQGPVFKKISNTSFSLKGEGWYTSDYKPKSKEALAESNALKGGTTDVPAAGAPAETPTASAKVSDSLPSPKPVEAAPTPVKSTEAKSKTE